MIVVAFHLFETYSQGPSHQIINHGYLAVDFFFVLSGFVIGYAYDGRLSKGMTTGRFFLRRIVRLQPMVVLGTLIGAFCVLFRRRAGFLACGRDAVVEGADHIADGIVHVPDAAVDGYTRLAGNQSAQRAQWSLLWEYIGNILYAFVFRRLSKLWLGVAVAFSSLLVIDLAFDIDTFGLA